MFDMTCLRLGCIRLTGGMPTLSLALTLLYTSSGGGQALLAGLVQHGEDLAGDVALDSG